MRAQRPLLQALPTTLPPSLLSCIPISPVFPLSLLMRARTSQIPPHSENCREQCLLHHYGQLQKGSRVEWAPLPCLLLVPPLALPPTVLPLSSPQSSRPCTSLVHVKCARARTLLL